MTKPSSPSDPNDIVRGNWVDRFLPPRLRPYARLMRLDRPAGTWLLLIPCWWGLLLARPASFEEALPFALLFGVGALIMRGAGCVVNDIADRSIDGRVARTRTRPLVAGEVSLRDAFLFLAFLLLLGLGVLLCFNRVTIAVGCASLVLVALYPFAKRVTWWPQFVLGLTFNWGALMGWTALRGSLDDPPLFLYGAGVLWTLAYDTAYACQDIEDDALIGVKSSARALGCFVKPGVLFFYVCFFALFALAGWQAGMGQAFAAPWAMTGGYTFALWRRWDPKDPSTSMRLFKANRDIGLALGVALAAGGLS